MKLSQSQLHIGEIALDVKNLAEHETPEYVQARIQEVLREVLSTLTKQQENMSRLQEMLTTPARDSASISPQTSTSSSNQYSPETSQIIKELEGVDASRDSKFAGVLPLDSVDKQLKDNVIKLLSAQSHLQKAIQEKIQTLEHLLKKSTQNESLIEEKEYWTNILARLQKGESYKNIYNQQGQERFTEFYTDFIVSYPLGDEFRTINWEETKKKIISRIQDKLLKQSEAEPYWEMLIRELQNPSNDILQLFADYQELFLILRDIFELPELPQSIDITIKSKDVYPKLFTDHIYANIGTSFIYDELRNLKITKVDGVYQILRELDEVIITNVGEKEINEDGSYPALFETQWYKKHRENAATDPNSTFWKASVINTEENKAYLYTTIEQRHAYYKFADAYLKLNGVISEWFDAAAKVTMNNLLTAEVTVGGASKGSLTSYFLSGDTNDFLRGGNKFLFAHNMKNVQALIEGKGTINLSFIDANGQQQTFEGLTKKQLDFKLVEFEQSLVQEYINSYVKDHQTDSGFIKFLEKYDMYDTPKENLQDVLDEINGLFQGKIIKEGIDITPYITKVTNQVPYVHFKDFSFIAEDGTELLIEKHFTNDNGNIYFDFNNYKHRVKLGQLMVEELYYQRYKDTLADKLEKVRQSPENFIADTPKTFKDYVRLNIPKKRLFLKDYYRILFNDVQRLEKIKINAEDHVIFNWDYISEKLSHIYDSLEKAWKEIEPEVMHDLERFYDELVDDLQKYINQSKNAIENLKELPEDAKKDVKRQIKQTIEEKKLQVEEFRQVKERLQQVEDIYHHGVDLYDEKLKELNDLKNKYINEESIEELAYDVGSSVLENIAFDIYPDLLKVVKDGDVESKKQALFKTDYKATAAILLYEFLKGEGKTPRPFIYGEHPFAEAILQGRVLDEIVKEMVDVMERDRYDFEGMPDSKVYELALEFSPTLSKKMKGVRSLDNLKEVPKKELWNFAYSLFESTDKHLDSNWAQLFLGGSLAYVYIEGSKLHGKIYNKTGKQSMGLQLGENDDSKANETGKRKPLSSIEQEIYFTFDLDKLKK